MDLNGGGDGVRHTQNALFLSHTHTHEHTHTLKSHETASGCSACVGLMSQSDVCVREKRKGSKRGMQKKSGDAKGCKYRVVFGQHTP